MKWPLTFYVNSLPKGFGGMAYGPVILILNKYKSDEGLYQHELLHVKQWLYTLGLHGIFYMFSNKYKLWAEVSAYKKQLQYTPGYEDLFGEFISTKYSLSITKEDAAALLRT